MAAAAHGAQGWRFGSALDAASASAGGGSGRVHSRSCTCSDSKGRGQWARHPRVGAAGARGRLHIVGVRRRARSFACEDGAVIPHRRKGASLAPGMNEWPGAPASSGGVLLARYAARGAVPMALAARSLKIMASTEGITRRNLSTSTRDAPALREPETHWHGWLARRAPRYRASHAAVARRGTIRRHCASYLIFHARAVTTFEKVVAMTLVVGVPTHVSAAQACAP